VGDGGVGCGRCGAGNASGAIVCARCGAVLAAYAPPPGSQAPSPPSLVPPAAPPLPTAAVSGAPPNVAPAAPPNPAPAPPTLAQSPTSAATESGSPDPDPRTDAVAGAVLVADEMAGEPAPSAPPTGARPPSSDRADTTGNLPWWTAWQNNPSLRTTPPKPRTPPNPVSRRGPPSTRAPAPDSRLELPRQDTNAPPPPPVADLSFAAADTWLTRLVPDSLQRVVLLIGAGVLLAAFGIALDLPCLVGAFVTWIAPLALIGRGLMLLVQSAADGRW